MATPAAAAAATEATAAATQQASDSLHVDAFKRLYADQYYERFLQAGCRPDGRGLTTARPVSVGLRAVSSADGSAIAKVCAAPLHCSASTPCQSMGTELI